jgi:dihydroorotate dehydrogenase electron transfer subunit
MKHKVIETSAMKKKIEDFIIVTKELYDNNHLYFELQAQHPFPDVFPGQFVQVQVKNNPDVFLRRPLSVHDWDAEKGVMSLWIKIVGKGTRSISVLEVGEILNVIYPLGNTFLMPDSTNERVLLVGGGCGAAPLLYLARHLHRLKIKQEIILGARSANEFLHPEKYEPLGNVHFMTEDGSRGGKGFVTHHPLLNSELNSIDLIYACGPEKMMKAVGKIAEKHNIPCQISLENLMACGIGACLCCIVKADAGNVCTCTEGPVFFTHQLKNWLHE